MRVQASKRQYRAKGAQPSTVQNNTQWSGLQDMFLTEESVQTEQTLTKLHRFRGGSSKGNQTTTALESRVSLLVGAKAHLGSSVVSRTMMPYVLGRREGQYLFNPELMANCWYEFLAFVGQLNGPIVVVGTRKDLARLTHSVLGGRQGKMGRSDEKIVLEEGHARDRRVKKTDSDSPVEDILKTAAESHVKIQGRMTLVTTQWLNGMLTNNHVLRQRVLSYRVTPAYELSRSRHKRFMIHIEALEPLRVSGQLPGRVVFLNGEDHIAALREANTAGVPTAAMVNSHFNHVGRVDFVLPCNTDVSSGQEAYLCSRRLLKYALRTRQERMNREVRRKEEGGDGWKTKSKRVTKRS